MWRTYAPWMEGALESEIVLIRAAMNRDTPAIERLSNTQIESTTNAPALAGFGTRLALGAKRPKLKRLIKRSKEVAERVGLEPT